MILNKLGAGSGWSVTGGDATQESKLGLAYHAINPGAHQQL